MGRQSQGTQLHRPGLGLTRIALAAQRGIERRELIRDSRVSRSLPQPGAGMSPRVQVATSDRNPWITKPHVPAPVGAQDALALDRGSLAVPSTYSPSALASTRRATASLDGPQPPELLGYALQRARQRFVVVSPFLKQLPVARVVEQVALLDAVVAEGPPVQAVGLVGGWSYILSGTTRREGKTCYSVSRVCLVQVSLASSTREGESDVGSIDRSRDQPAVIRPLDCEHAGVSENKMA